MRQLMIALVFVCAGIASAQAKDWKDMSGSERFAWSGNYGREYEVTHHCKVDRSGFPDSTIIAYLSNPFLEEKSVTDKIADRCKPLPVVQAKKAVPHKPTFVKVIAGVAAAIPHEEVQQAPQPDVSATNNKIEARVNADLPVPSSTPASSSATVESATVSFAERWPSSFVERWSSIVGPKILVPKRSKQKTAQSP